MFKIFIGFCVISIPSFCMEKGASDSSLHLPSQKLPFSELDHAQLTEAWTSENYGLDIYPGQCINCLILGKHLTKFVTDTRPIKPVLGLKGCHVHGETHGFCRECLHLAIHPLVNPNFNAKFFTPESTRFQHKLKDGTVHYCKITLSQIDSFINDLKDIPEGWEACVSAVEQIAIKNKDRADKRRNIASLPYLCKVCNKFKIPENIKNMFEGNSGWIIVCPGCSYNYALETANCSILHCGECSRNGVGVSTCGYCFQVMVNGTVVREGYKPTSHHKCPSDCNKPFHGDIDEHRIPSKIKLVCECDSREKDF